MDLISDNSGLALYKRYFPHVTPNIFQQELIELVSDLTLWEETLRFWAGNDYRGQSVMKMLEYYEKLKKERDASSSYTVIRNQPTQREAIEAEQAKIREELGI